MSIIKSVPKEREQKEGRRKQKKSFKKPLTNGTKGDIIRT